MDVNRQVAAYRDAMVEQLSRLIRIPSVQGEAQPGMPFGKDVHDALVQTLSLARALGFETVKEVDGYAGYVEIGQGKEEIGVLVHVDVVPAGDDGWSVDPFAGTVKDNRVYGRGATDNKGAAIAALYALLALKTCGVALNRRVRLIVGCNEETGMRDLDYYDAHVGLPDYAFAPDGNYPIINVERGILQVHAACSCAPTTTPGARIVSIHAGLRPNVVPGSATAVLACEDPQPIIDAFEAYRATCPHSLQLTAQPGLLTLSAEGAVGHAARPHLGANAAGMLLEALAALPLAQGQTEQAVRAMAQHIGYTMYGERLGIASEDEVSGKTTCNLGILNVEHGEIAFTLDIRHCVSITEADILAALQRAFAGIGFAFTPGHRQVSHIVPADAPLVQKLLDVYHAQTGGETYCISIGGGTYARKMPGRAVAFGTTFPGNTRLAHVADEYFDIDELVLNAQIIAQACIKLANEPLS